MIFPLLQISLLMSFAMKKGYDFLNLQKNAKWGQSWKETKCPMASLCMLHQLHVVKLHYSCPFLMHANKTNIYPTSKHQWLFHIMFSQNHKAMITVEPRYEFTNSSIKATSLDSSTSPPNIIIRTKQSKVQQTTLQTSSPVSMQLVCTGLEIYQFCQPPATSERCQTTHVHSKITQRVQKSEKSVKRRKARISSRNFFF